MSSVGFLAKNQCIFLVSVRLIPPSTKFLCLVFWSVVNIKIK